VLSWHAMAWPRSSCVLSAVIVASALIGCGSDESPPDGACAGESSPKVVVQAFFDALIENDRDRALTYVLDEAEKTAEFTAAWASYAEWKFTEADVVDVDGEYVKVHFIIELPDGSKDEGADDTRVKHIDCKWWIVEIPE
jgi:hypothetical protein